MQTFLPLPDDELTARVLDPRRLNKQRQETIQILRTLRGITHGWRNHPAVKMWSGSENALVLYGLTIHYHCNLLGIADNVSAEDKLLDLYDPKQGDERPWWYGHEPFHASHRAALLQKDPAYYETFGWAEAPGIDYFWPTKHTPIHR